MLSSMMIILVCQLIGEFLTGFFSLPVPGPVMGMLLLIAVLAFRERFGTISSSPDHYALEKAGYSLLGLLPLLFVPITVGIMNKGPVLREYGVAIITAIAVSTLLTLAVSAWVFLLIARWTHTEREES